MPFSPDEKSIARSLAAQVKETFPHLTWPADVPASPDDDLNGDYINKHFPGKKWTEITDCELGWAGQDTGWFTDEALAYFLPAWLVSYLEEHYPGGQLRHVCPRLDPSFKSTSKPQLLHSANPGYSTKSPNSTLTYGATSWSTAKTI